MSTNTEKYKVFIVILSCTLTFVSLNQVLCNHIFT